MRGFVVATFCLTTVGCGTLMNIIGAGTPPTDGSVLEPQRKIYGGVFKDTELIGDALYATILGGPIYGPPNLMLGVAGAVDLPFSFVGDTLTLPVTVPATFASSQHSTELVADDAEPNRD